MWFCLITACHTGRVVLACNIGHSMIGHLPPPPFLACRELSNFYIAVYNMPYTGRGGKHHATSAQEEVHLSHEILYYNQWRQKVPF